MKNASNSCPFSFPFLKTSLHFVLTFLGSGGAIRRSFLEASTWSCQERRLSCVRVCVLSRSQVTPAAHSSRSPVQGDPPSPRAPQGAAQSRVRPAAPSPARAGPDVQGPRGAEPVTEL